MKENYKKIVLIDNSSNYEEKVFGFFNQIHNLFDFGKTITDLGCGHGKYSIICRNLGYDVVGIDARDTRIPFEEKGIKWVISDVDDLKNIESDTILYFGLLYHLNYQQQINLLKKLKTNLLIINTHFADIKNNEINNITKKDKLSIPKNKEYDGLIYEEAKNFDSLKVRPLASFSNLTSFWPTLDELSKMLRIYGGFNEIYVVEPYLISDRTYIIAKK